MQGSSARSPGLAVGLFENAVVKQMRAKTGQVTFCETGMVHRYRWRHPAEHTRPVFDNFSAAGAPVMLRMSAKCRPRPRQQPFGLTNHCAAAPGGLQSWL